MRFLISDNKIHPIAWEVSKIEDTMPQGITFITVKQVMYNPATDNNELMIADYYKSKIEPEEPEVIKPEIKIKYNSPAAIKVGGSYKVFSAISDDSAIDTTRISWTIEGLNDDEYTSILSQNTIKIKAAKNYNLIGRVFTLHLFYAMEEVDSIQVEVIGL